MVDMYDVSSMYVPYDVSSMLPSIYRLLDSYGTEYITIPDPSITGFVYARVKCFRHADFVLKFSLLWHSLSLQPNSCISKPYLAVISVRRPPRRVKVTPEMKLAGELMFPKSI